MNRTLDGKPITRADHIALALLAGMPASKVTRDTKTWVFELACRDLRFLLWCAGFLLLDTRPVHQPAPKAAIDTEMVAFLTRQGA